MPDAERERWARMDPAERPAVYGDPTKICTGCKRELPADTEHFHRHKTSPGGIRSKCKDCIRAADRRRRPRRKPDDSPFTAATVRKIAPRAVVTPSPDELAAARDEFDAALASLVALTDEVPRTVADLSTPEGRAAVIRRQESRRALMEELRPHYEPNEMWLEFAAAVDGDQVEALGKALGAAGIVVVPS